MSTPLLRVELDVDAAAAEHAVAVAWRLGAQGVAVRDASTGDAPPGRAVVCFWHPPAGADAVVAQAQTLLGDGGVRAVPEGRWQDALDAAPVAVGGFTLCPAGPPSARRIVIEPGTAFGAGTHPTTAACIDAMEALWPTRRPATVLDVGTGTGVLALVAAALGADVAATDIDPLARAAARRHAELNGRRIAVGAELPAGRFDLVVANLYLEPLLSLMPALVDRIAPGGALIVSGFTAARASAVEAAAAAGTLIAVDRRDRDDWLAITLSESEAQIPIGEDVR